MKAAELRLLQAMRVLTGECPCGCGGEVTNCPQVRKTLDTLQEMAKSRDQERDALVNALVQGLQNATPSSWWASNEVIRWEACAQAMADVLQAHGLIFNVEEFLAKARGEEVDHAEE